MLTCGIFVLLASGCEITPKDWGPVSSYYDGTPRVRGSGTFYNDGYQDAANRMRITDPADDGNTVYGRTTFYVWKCCDVHGGPTWKQDQSKTTPEWRNSTRTYTLRTSLDAVGSRYRADAEPCAQMGWPVPDSCESAFPTFDY